MASDTVTGEFKFTDTYDNFSWIISGTGPSVMLSYIVTSSPSIPSFNSLFSSTYKNKRSSNNGVAVEDDALLTYDSVDIRTHYIDSLMKMGLNSTNHTILHMTIIILLSKLKLSSPRPMIIS